MVLRTDGGSISILHLLGVDGIPGQLCQMDKFQVKGPELGQNAASSRGPSPAPTGATATWTASKHVNITSSEVRNMFGNVFGDVCVDCPQHKSTQMTTFSSNVTVLCARFDKQYLLYLNIFTKACSVFLSKYVSKQPGWRLSARRRDNTHFTSWCLSRILKQKYFVKMVVYVNT